MAAQPACAYALRLTWVWVGTQPAAQAGTQQCPAAGTAWAGGQCSASSCPVSLHQESRFTRSQIIFFCSLAVALGSAAFFVSFSFPSLLSIPNNPVHSFPTRCRRYHSAATYRPYGLSAFCLCSPRIPCAPSSGRDPCYLGCIKRYLNPQGNESLSVHPNCTFQGSLGSSRLGPPNRSQTVSVSSPQSRSSSSASPAASQSQPICLLASQVSLSVFPIRIRLRFWCLLFLPSCVSIARR